MQNNITHIVFILTQHVAQQEIEQKNNQPLLNLLQKKFFLSVSVSKTPPAIRGRGRVWGFSFLDWVALTVLLACRRRGVVLLLLFGLWVLRAWANCMQARRLVAIMQERGAVTCCNLLRAAIVPAVLLPADYRAAMLSGCHVFGMIIGALFVTGYHCACCGYFGLFPAVIWKEGDILIYVFIS